MAKRFRVLETHKVEVWSYVWANDVDHAIKRFEAGGGETEWCHPESTDLEDDNWDSLEQYGDDCRHNSTILKGRCYRCGETIEKKKEGE